MNGEPWLYVAFAFLVTLHTLSLAALALRSRSHPGTADDGADRDAAAVDRAVRDVDGAARTVDCPACGAANEAYYRFCRSCVAEIPGADDGGLTSAPSRTGDLQ